MRSPPASRVRCVNRLASSLARSLATSIAPPAGVTSASPPATAPDALAAGVACGDASGEGVSAGWAAGAPAAASLLAATFRSSLVLAPAFALDVSFRPQGSCHGVSPQGHHGAALRMPSRKPAARAELPVAGSAWTAVADCEALPPLSIDGVPPLPSPRACPLLPSWLADGRIAADAPEASIMGLSSNRPPPSCCFSPSSESVRARSLARLYTSSLTDSPASTLAATSSATSEA